MSDGSATFLKADAARLPFADKSVDLVLGSPPYCDARTYGINAQRGCQEWVEWMLTVTAEAVRVSRGMVIWVCAGVTRDWCYWPAPEGLLYEWQKQGGRCWRPAYWNRVGIPGSGGKQWLRADVEYCLAFTNCAAAIPWSDNTANGHPPKWAPGGAMSHRLSSGTRKNQWGGGEKSTGGTRRKDGTLTRPAKPKPSHRFPARSVVTIKRDGQHSQESTTYQEPVIANPGNCISGINVGGSIMGSKLCHENEAPYPEALAKWFIRHLCPPGGIVLDPFSGSGTTASAAVQLGRNGIGTDIRESQVELSRRRCASLQPEMMFT